MAERAAEGRCSEHVVASAGCARCAARTKESAVVERFKARLIAHLRAGWPCRLPGGDIYGPFEDALAMVADALESGSPPLNESEDKL